jgi:hypothetical protein
LNLKTVLTAALCVAALAACDKAKPRPPVDGGPPAPASTAPVAVGPILSEGLHKRDEYPGFYLDKVGSASDPVVHKPAVTSGEAPIELAGFGFDPVAKAPAKGVDVVIDGKAYPTKYGAKRPDVARYMKNPALEPVAYTMTLPARALDAGEHIVVVRIIAADGSGYFESPQIKFEVR